MYKYKQKTKFKKYNSIVNWLMARKAEKSKKKNMYFENIELIRSVKYVLNVLKNFESL